MRIAKYDGEKDGKLTMYFMKNFIMAAVLAIAFASCAHNEKEDASRIFSQATEAYESDKYNLTKILLDSIIFNFPNQKEVVGSARELMSRVYKAEQEQNLAYLDSVLTLRNEEIEILLKKFYVEDETVEVPTYIHKSQRTYSSHNRCYVRSFVNANGVFYISSHFTGENHIFHNRIKASVDDSYVMTDCIENDAYKHYFENGEMVWEIVKYKNGTDNETGSFIARNHDKRIKISFLSERTSYNTIMTEVDRKALYDTFLLSTLLRERTQIVRLVEN